EIAPCIENYLLSKIMTGGIDMYFAYKSILVAVDGSSEAERAFEKAIGIAKRNTAVLNIIYVVDSRSYTAIKLHEPHIEDEAFKHGRELLEGYKAKALDSGVQEAHTFVVPGSPKKVIARDYAKQLSADLIVCGAQGLNAFEHFLLGSVSQHIVRSSPCDVLVVRQTGPKNKKPKERIEYK